MGRTDLVERLAAEAEEQYRVFNQKFVVTNSNPMLGVKVPKMRSIAREITGGDWREFLRGYGFYAGEVPEGTVASDTVGGFPGTDTQLSGIRRESLHAAAARIKDICSGVYFEEIMIMGMVIDLAPVEPVERLQMVEQFVPLIDNWAVCDVFCGGAKWVGEPGKGPKARLRVSRERVWMWLQGYLLGDEERGLSGRKEFEIRFGVVMLMSYFLREEYMDSVFEVLAKVHFGDYYVDMAVAWCLATARAKFDLQTQEFVARAGFPQGVMKKYHQKVRDSLRMRKVSSSR